MADTPGTSKPIVKADVERASRWGRALLAMVERRPEIAEELGITDEEVQRIRYELAQNEEFIPKIPTARAMFMAALSGGTTREEVLTRHHSTMVAVHALAPIAGYVLAAKLDDEKSPGSTRVALEIAKGTGVLVQAEPMRPKQRQELLAEDALEGKSDDELRAEILEDV